MTITLPATGRSRVPRATYRLQFQPRFTLRDAQALVPYLDQLGVSHVYASPLLQAMPGSTHGYDTRDFSRLNADLGTETDLEALVQALHRRGMGLVLDIVPNHMGVGPGNAWWWDVLAHGARSRFAHYFDIDWNPPDPQLRGKVLLPVLGREYRTVLEAGEFKVQLQRGQPVVGYFEHAFPLVMTPQWIGQRTLPELLKELNSRPALLDEVLEQQHYRLTHWGYGDKQVNYRRFFNISSLAGLRIEEPEVFAAVHERVLEWVRRGWVDGLRVDHIDGLRDPARYLAQLHAAAPDVWLVVEKILGAQESLPEDWPVAGTTGYDFLNRVSGLFIDASTEPAFTDLYTRFTGEPGDYDVVVREAQRLALRELLSAEVSRLLQWAVKAAARNWRGTFVPPPVLREALIEVVACFPVYRSYVQADTRTVRETDELFITQAVDAARRERPDLAPALFDFIADLLLLRWDGEAEREFVMRFQQLTGPAMAKGAEDTACYRYNRLVALNTVGGEPGHFGLTPERFHLSCLHAQQRWPAAMLATSTHDTKRSEDVRARLCLLSELPEEWRQAVERWSTMNQRHRSGRFPDRNCEYFYYQTLVGAWPLPLDRALVVMEKVVCEAKQHTSWNRRNAEYERVIREFITQTLGDSNFLADVGRFVERLVEPGWVNSLAQALLKLTTPGVPDIYQGTELWDGSLVDPDNRRPVDFDQRERLLNALRQMPLDTVWQRRADGLPKLWLTQKTLHLRRRHPEGFSAGSSYAVLRVSGRKARHAVAFQRGKNVVVVAPRLVLRLAGDWADTELQLPGGEWHNEFTGETVAGSSIKLAELLLRFPVALLTRKEKAG